jgi:hypothetical protein
MLLRAAPERDAEPLRHATIVVAEEPMSSHALSELGHLVDAKFAEVRRRCPDLPDLGGCVLLGKHYAHPASKVLYLGINPGVARSTTMDTAVQPYNWLLEGPNADGHAHWTNARKFFAAVPALRSVFETATFSFCCPYRTENWMGLSTHDRDILMAVSRPILRKMIADCHPTLIVAAGRSAYETICEMLRPEWHHKKTLSRGGSGGTYQWSATSGAFSDQEMLIVQLPHFSRANSKSQLTECANWLASVVASAGV